MGNSVSSIGNATGNNFLKQYGMQQLGAQATNSPMKAVGGYWANPGYQQMQQRLYGTPQMTGQYQTSKSVAQPSSVTNPFANYRSMNMMPYWMALTRRFMGY